MFIDSLNTSLIAGVMILGVVLARFILRKAPRFIICLLWALVAVRLLLPASVEVISESAPTVSGVQKVETEGHHATINNMQFVAPSATGLQMVGTTPENSPSAPSAELKVPTQSEDVKTPVTEAVPEVSEERAEKGLDFGGIPTKAIKYANVVWLVGIAVMALYFAISYIRLRLKTRVCMRKEKCVWLCDDISSSFIMGIIRPRIMIPTDIDPEEEKYVLLHERSHLERLDHVWKMLSCVLLAVYWYNPLVWVAFTLFARDIEYACDERVISQNGDSIKAPYARAMINCAAASIVSPMGTIAFGKKSVVGRVKNVLNYKKPSVWIIIAVLLIGTVMTVCSMTAPVSGEGALFYEEKDETTEETEESKEPTEETSGTEPTDNTEATEEPAPSTEATEAKPTEPKPTEPKPTEPKPTEPKPTEPKPTEPNPTEPKPTEPKPTEPKPTEPKPTEPKPTEPDTVYEEEPDISYSVLARTDMLVGEDVGLNYNRFYDRACRAYYNERLKRCIVPITHSIVEGGETMNFSVGVATSVPELRYVTRSKGTIWGDEIPPENDRSYFEMHFGDYTEEFFADNALIILFDSVGPTTSAHEVFATSYQAGELCLGIHKRTENDGWTTHDFTIWITVVEVPKSVLNKVNTVSFYVERNANI